MQRVHLQLTMENQISTTVQKRDENQTDLPVLGLAGCHAQGNEHCRTEWKKQVRRLASQSVSPDQMGVFVGSGPK